MQAFPVPSRPYPTTLHLLGGPTLAANLLLSSGRHRNESTEEVHGPPPRRSRRTRQTLTATARFENREPDITPREHRSILHELG